MKLKAKIQKWGNSLAVRIPRPFAAEIGIEENSSVEIFEGVLPDKMPVTGAILANQLRSFDWRAREAVLITTVPDGAVVA